MKPEPTPRSQTETLVQGILARTTGSVCAHAREQICAFVDGACEVTDHRLVAKHLAHCESCADQALLLTRLHRELPKLAEVQAPRTLTRDILGATSQRPPVVERTWWHRPRLALETAYLASAAGFIFFSLPLPGPAQALIHRMDQRASQLPGRLLSLRSAVQAELPDLDPSFQCITEPSAGFALRRWQQVQVWWTAALDGLQAFRQRHFPPRKPETREPAAPPVRSAP